MAKVHLRHDASGEVRLIDEPLFDTDYETAEYMWTEGNYGCDCNRALNFYNWGPEANDRPCGHKDFTARFVEFADGRKIELEWDEILDAERVAADRQQRGHV